MLQQCSVVMKKIYNQRVICVSCLKRGDVEGNRLIENDLCYTKVCSSCYIGILLKEREM